MGINLTRLLCDALSVSDGKFAHQRRAYWPLFAQTEVLDEVRVVAGLYVQRARWLTRMLADVRGNICLL